MIKLVRVCNHNCNDDSQGAYFRGTKIARFSSGWLLSLSVAFSIDVLALGSACCALTKRDREEDTIRSASSPFNLE